MIEVINPFTTFPVVPIFGFVSALIAGISAAWGAYSGWKKGKDAQKRYEEQQKYQQALANRRTPSVGTGRMLAGIIRGGGLADVVGTKYLDYISNASNYGKGSIKPPDMSQGFDWGGLGQAGLGALGQSYSNWKSNKGQNQNQNAFPEKWNTYNENG